MTDLRVTDEVDGDMIRDMNRPVDGFNTPLPEPTPEIAPEVIELLKRHGFDHVPTEEELRNYKTQRQAEVREEVLFQADRKHWCEDGTRKVCANLRIPRPGNKESHEITFRVTMDVTLEARTYTARGALAHAVDAYQIPREGEQWYGGGRASNVTMTNLAVDGTPYDLETFVREELSNDVREELPNE